MPGVFISYRREDSSGQAGRLFDILSVHFGKQNTFMDIDDITGGDNFVTVIEQQVGACDVLLAIIGERWLTIAGENGVRRLDNSGDFVRLEIAKALERGVRVVPVLVGKATMPRPEDLPDDLRPLSLREAADLRDEHFRDDANRLIDLLDKTAPGLARRPWKAKNRLVPVVASILAIAAVVGGFLLFRKPAAAPANQALTSSGSIASPQAPQSAKTPADIAGKWKATVTYDWPGAVYAENFDFEVDGAEVSGTASFLTGGLGLFDGKIEGDRVTFTTKSISSMDEKTSQDQHFYKGTVEADTIRFSMLTDSSIESHVPIHFTANRVKAK